MHEPLLSVQLMNNKTKNLTLSALFSALAVISLFFASIWPTGQLGLAAVASLFVAAAVVESGISYGICVFAVSSTIGMLLIPNRVPSLLFVLFFGYYPIVKSLIELLSEKILRWALKLLVFNASLSVMWFLLRPILFEFEADPGVIAVYLVGNAVFAVFDHGFTKVIWLYIVRVSLKRKKKKR